MVAGGGAAAVQNCRTAELQRTAATCWNLQIAASLFCIFINSIELSRNGAS